MSTRVLALDYGSARCGTAVSDASGTIATPLDGIARPGTRRGLSAIADLVDELGAERVVVGLPLSLSGDDTPQTTETREFAARLAQRLRVPVELYDERLTTQLAQRTGRAAESAPRAGEDSRAAAHLLEGWLALRAREPASDRSGEVGSPPHRAPADR
jgi:putative Holliday junction resolvase